MQKFNFLSCRVTVAIQKDNDGPWMHGVIVKEQWCRPQGVIIQSNGNEYWHSNKAQHKGPLKDTGNDRKMPKRSDPIRQGRAFNPYMTCTQMNTKQSDK